VLVVGCVAAGWEPAEGRRRTRRYRVEVTVDERAELEAMLRRGRASARRPMRARVLLFAAEDRLDQETAAAVRCGERTVERVRRRSASAGGVSLTVGVLRHARPGRPERV
jgi:hypothetical protein